MYPRSLLKPSSLFIVDQPLDETPSSLEAKVEAAKYQPDEKSPLAFPV